MGLRTAPTKDTLSKPAARLPSSARQAALAVLQRVDRGGLANRVLEMVLSRGSMDAGERALTTALVEGVLRNRSWLDFVLAQCCKHPLDSMPPLIVEVLRLGAFQLLFHERQQDALVVSDSVNLARRCGHEGTAALVNAVLRAVARGHEQISPPGLEKDPVAHISVRWSHPQWIVQRWVERFGPEQALLTARADNEPPDATLRVNPLRTDSATLARDLEEEGLSVQPGPLAPGTLQVRGSAHLVATAAYRNGSFSLQGAASVIAGLLASPPRGARVVDMCAGSGGKTTHLAQMMQDRGEILACDVDRRRLSVLKSECERLGISIVRADQRDARTLPATEDFDCCLLDAPCSGTGSLRRRPDIRWHRKEEDLPSLARLQQELLAAAGGLVKRKGWILYSTCSLEPEENEHVVAEFLSARPDFRAVDCRPLLPMLGAQDFLMEGKAVLLLPHSHGTDGMFMMRLERTGVHP